MKFNLQLKSTLSSLYYNLVLVKLRYIIWLYMHKNFSAVSSFVHFRYINLLASSKMGASRRGYTCEANLPNFF